MAIILCGMVGVTYAITATDADQYVTRSQYAVDMAYLQNKLDEAEAGLMGQINRYRSTDVKFVTFDTPNKYYQSTHWSGGIHNGGNFGGRPKVAGAAYSFPGTGIVNNNSNPEKINGRFADYCLFRLYNGNYYITKNIHMNNQASSPVIYFQTLNYAVPVENFPGWYLVVRMYYQAEHYLSNYISLVKLDPNSTVTPPEISDTLQLRFKKDLFVYAGASSQRITTTKKSSNVSFSYYYNNTNGPLVFRHINNQSYTGSHSFNISGWLDEATGDYMMTIKGMARCKSTSNTDIQHYTYYLNPGNTSAAPVSVLMPADNVEYVTGNILGTFDHGDSAIYRLIPIAGQIGTGYGNDPTWEYEFVDCDNGIKFWHAYHPPELVKHGTGNPMPLGVHYSLPIVY